MAIVSENVSPQVLFGTDATSLPSRFWIAILCSYSFFYSSLFYELNLLQINMASWASDGSGNECVFNVFSMCFPCILYRQHYLRVNTLSSPFFILRHRNPMRERGESVEYINAFQLYCIGCLATWSLTYVSGYGDDYILCGVHRCCCVGLVEFVVHCGRWLTNGDDTHGVVMFVLFFQVWSILQ